MRTIISKLAANDRLKNIIFGNKALYYVFIIARFKIKTLSDKSGISKKDIAKMLPKNPVVVEIGAYTGGDTVEMALLWPKGAIYAFEPIPEIFERLKFKTRFFKNIHIFNLAVSDSDVDKRQMFVSNNGCSSSLLEPTDEHLKEFAAVSFDLSIKVKNIRLLDWARINNIERIDFLWIDAQGMELKIFQSAGDFIRKIKLIYTEVSLKEFYKESDNYEELKKYLARYGFELYKDDLLPGASMGNALFINKFYE